MFQRRKLEILCLVLFWKLKFFYVGIFLEEVTFRGQAQVKGQISFFPPSFPLVIR